MSYRGGQRSAPRHSRVAAELLGLALVMLTGSWTAWQAQQRVGLNLSGLADVASFLGYADPSKPLDGQTGLTTAQDGGTGQVSFSGPQPGLAVPGTAAFCAPGQSPVFALGLGILKQRIGDVMGNPLECEHPSGPDGSTLQKTTTGLAAYRSASNTVTFTDGYQHWELDSDNRLVTWTGDTPDPPAGAQVLT